MLVQATRTLSTLTMRALFYGGLFVVVVIVHLGLTGALRAQGWGPSASLLASGAVVLGLVLLHAEPAQRDEDDPNAMPWEIAGPLRARYPKLARRLGVEGVAVAEFEVSANGVAKNIHCVYAWPSDVFYEAAREALTVAKFQPKPDTHVRFGSSYRIPFVFRIAGAAKVQESGRRARKLSPTLHAAQQAVEKLRGTG
jgi:TonB family protein